MMIVKLLLSFVASSLFGVIFNIPKRLLPHSGFVGMSGWAMYMAAARSGVDGVAATFAAAFFVAFVSNGFARRYRTPATIFIVSGIIPLVPGGTAFEAMRHVVMNDYNAAISLAAKAFMISGAIAMGLIFSEVVNQLVKRRP
ncbi:threonine/serine exporter family protein [Geobacillus stearothermophilus]|uniref:threonine/serine exporter family protein n=1 Tax=Geobacillus stearothermophilus TaxID=1422 RepID=UPI002E20E4F0|nr:threonine/serine exporter family protein [Geobacillus stearothermophilus]MED4355967.1 threonine/serine exporter family protein [Geobacillus stearothermophilus]